MKKELTKKEEEVGLKIVDMICTSDLEMREVVRVLSAVMGSFLKAAWMESEEVDVVIRQQDIEACVQTVRKTLNKFASMK